MNRRIQWGEGLHFGVEGVDVVVEMTMKTGDQHSSLIQIRMMITTATMMKMIRSKRMGNLFVDNEGKMVTIEVDVALRKW